MCGCDCGHGLMENTPVLPAGGGTAGALWRDHRCLLLLGWACRGGKFRRGNPGPDLSLLLHPVTLLSPAGADYGQISEETWVYLSTLYGGGPEIAIRQNVAQVQELENLHGEQKIEAETRAV